MDHAARVQRIQRRRGFDTLPEQVRVALVLKDRDVVFTSEGQQRVAAIQRQDARCGVLDGRDGVDEFRRDALRLQLGELVGQRVNDDAVAVQLHAHQLGTQLAEPVHRALVTVFLGQHRVAGVDQQLADHIKALARSGGDQDVLDRGGDAALPLALVGNELA